MDRHPVTQQSRNSSSADSAPPQTELERVVAVAQHKLTNPLAALLAELQLLQMESTLADDHRAAVDRITELVRRIIALVRDLEQRIINDVAG
jgi:signal transduction histidine kinase